MTDDHHSCKPEDENKCLNHASNHSALERAYSGDQDNFEESLAGEASMHLVEELQSYYQDTVQQNRAALQRAWQRISAYQANFQDMHPSPLTVLRSSYERAPMIQSQSIPEHKQGRKVFRRLGLMAAVLVMALLIGSMALVFQATRQGTARRSSTTQQARQTPTQPTLQEIASSPGLYLITQADKNQNSQVTKVDKKTGKVLWNTFIGFEASSTIVADDLVFGTTSSKNTDQSSQNHHFVYALSAKTGKLIWQADIDALSSSSSSSSSISGIDTNILGTPAFANGIVYITSATGKVYALNGANGSLLWTRDVSDTGDNNNVEAPTVANGVVYGVMLNKLYAINAKTGALLWLVSAAADYSFGSPAVDHGTIYVSLAPPSTHTSNNPAKSAIVAYRASNGSRLWEHGDYYWAGFLDQAPVLVHGLVYVANVYTGIYALDSQTGHTRWQKVLGTDAFTNSAGCSWPVASGNVVYSNCGNLNANTTRLTAYDATRGTILWSQPSVANPVSVDQNILYGTSYPGLVFSFKTDNGTALTQHTYGELFKDKFGDPWAPEPYLTLVP